MPRGDYKTCRECGKHTREAGPISQSRLCGPCGIERERQAIVDLATHSGPTFQLWRRRIAASVGAALLDDVKANP